jgi:hypothetical protein
MRASEVPRAVAAGMACAAALDLRVEDAVVVHNSNRMALRLLPCEVLARVAPAEAQAATEFELLLARRLADTDSPVAELEPRVEPRLYLRDGFAVTLWTYYRAVPPGDFAPAESAEALQRLHAGMRQVTVKVPHSLRESPRLSGWSATGDDARPSWPRPGSSEGRAAEIHRRGRRSRRGRAATAW